MVEEESGTPGEWLVEAKSIWDFSTDAPLLSPIMCNKQRVNHQECAKHHKSLKTEFGSKWARFRDTIDYHIDLIIWLVAAFWRVFQNIYF